MYVGFRENFRAMNLGLPFLKWCASVVVTQLQDGRRAPIYSGAKADSRKAESRFHAHRTTVIDKSRCWMAPKETL